MIPTARLPRAFVARTLRLGEIPPGAPARECDPFDYDRFSIVANPRAMIILGEDLGFTEDRIRSALALEFADPAIIAEAPWARLLAQVLNTDYLGACDLDLAGSHGLRKILYPFLNLARDYIDVWRGRHSCVWDQLGEVLLNQASNLLIHLVLKTVLLEANILRELRPRTSESLVDDGEDQDFSKDFEAHCVGSTFFVRKFYLRYAALSRLLAVTTLHWRDNVSEVLERLEQDRATIAADFFDAPFGALCRISGTLSDSHDRGRAVLFLEFDCGCRLVYKPRSLQIDTVFQRLAGLVAASGVTPVLRCLRLVDRSDYGWVEHVRYQPLRDIDEAPDFFFRQGVNLALVQLLGGTDFHSENIIAEGSQPILVDLEALLHPQPRRGEDARAIAPAEDWLGNTVFVSGLLPGWARGEDMREPDLSGMGAGQTEEFYRREGAVVRRDEQGNLRIVNERIAVPQRENRLMFDGETVRPLSYVEDIVAGFRAAYDALIACKSQLADEGAIPGDGVVRYIPLDTSTYGHTLQQSLHPDFTRRSVHRELVAASLAYRAPHLDFVRPLIPAEIDAVFEGDIPKFVARLDSTTITDQRSTSIADFLRETPLGIFRQKIAAMSAADRNAQCDIIRLTMATLLKVGEPGADSQPRLAAGLDELPKADVLAEVAEIAEAILEHAIVANGEPDWVIITQGENGRSALLPAGTDVYDGAGGVGLFLLEAGRRLGDSRFLEMGRACGERLSAAMGREPFVTGGAYNGAASGAWALFRLGQGFAERAWCERACEELARLGGLVENDRTFDLVGGCAGYAAVTLDVFRATGDARLRDAAIAAADFLIAKRVACDVGHALPPRHGDRPLTGFSHGAAGMGYALLHIGAEFGRDDLIEAGYSAYDYEYSRFEAAIDGYPDLRAIFDKDQPSDSGAWCHGGPGITLSRIAMPRHLRRERDQACIAHGLTRILACPLAPNDCLCHGEIGNCEVLLAAACADGDSRLAVEARRRMSTAVTRKRDVGSWRGGAIPRVFIPGAMIGMAGVGLGLLRGWDPAGLRSILVPC